jgi:hypothetical protein
MTLNSWKPEPAMILYAINAAVALVVSFGLPLNGGQVGAITVLATAILATWTAATTRPIVVSSITGAVGTALAAVAAFGFHLSGDQIGSIVTVLSIVLALLLRQNVSPSPALATRR